MKAQILFDPEAPREAGVDLRALPRGRAFDDLGEVPIDWEESDLAGGTLVFGRFTQGEVRYEMP